MLFAILNGFSIKTFSEAVLFAKSLKSLKAISCWKQALSNSFLYIYLQSNDSLNFCILYF